MKLAISALEIFLILLVVLSLATGFVESIMTPRISFPLVTKRFSSSKYDTARKPNRVPIKSYAKVPATKVVTDIDDTVKSSGGVKLFGIPLGGIDTQFRRGEFYPGAFQFAFELSSSIKKAIPENVAVLTARAREFKFALALKPGDKICSAYRAIGRLNGFSDWGIGADDVYYGSVVEWVFQERKGIRKLANFEIMVENDAKNRRDCNYIIVGDTGEKDEEAGERIAKKFGPKKIRAVFLHCVSDSPDRSLLLLPKDRQMNGVPIFYFRTYVGAASKAFQNRLMTVEGLQRVIDAAKNDLLVLENKVNTYKIKTLQPIISSRRNELERDINEAKIVKRTVSFQPAFLNSVSNDFNQKLMNMIPK